jgi:hypothetical protein
MSDDALIPDTDYAPTQFPPDRRRLVSLVVGTALVAAGVVWCFAGRPLAWTILFNENNHLGWEDANGQLSPSAVEELARGIADHDASTHWSLLLPLAVLVGLGLALITMMLATFRGAEKRTSLATNRGRSGIAAAVFGLVLAIVAASAPDPNGITLFGGSYDAKIWLPVFIVGLALLVGGVVLILVERAASPLTRARRAADADLIAVGVAEAELHRRAEDIKTWEQAYALAHNGETPPPGFVPPGAFTTATPRSNTNGLAIAAFIVAIAVNGVVGLVLGYVARRQIDDRHEGGRGLAVAAIVIGWVEIGLGAVATVVLAVIWLRGT